MVQTIAQIPFQTHNLPLLLFRTISQHSTRPKPRPYAQRVNGRAWRRFVPRNREILLSCLWALDDHPPRAQGRCTPRVLVMNSKVQHLRVQCLPLYHMEDILLDTHILRMRRNLPQGNHQVLMPRGIQHIHIAPQNLVPFPEAPLVHITSP